MARKLDVAKREQIAGLLAAGASLRGAARAASADRETVRRLAQDEGFSARVHQLRGDLESRLHGRLASVAVRSMSRLETLILAAETDDDVRLRAIRGCLADLVTLGQHRELAARVAALEASAAKMPRGRYRA